MSSTRYDEAVMLHELVKQFPKVTDLLALTDAQRDSALLICIASRANDPRPVAAKFTFIDEVSGLYPIIFGQTTYEDSATVDAQLMASWKRLETSGLIMQAPGQAFNNMTLTPRGREVTQTSNVTEIVARTYLRREMLHHLLQAHVYENFASGNYDGAVRDAFVILEDSVKLDSKNAKDIGVNLMRSAFNPTNGPLTKMTLHMAERERMADLFAGAIGVFKNPHSHRVVGNTEPAPVIEELLLASRLLRFIRPDIVDPQNVRL